MHDVAKPRGAHQPPAENMTMNSKLLWEGAKSVEDSTLSLGKIEKSRSLLRPSGWVSGATRQRECWKRRPRLQLSRLPRGIPESLINDLRVADTRRAYRTFENEQDVTPAYLNTIVMAAVAGRIASNLLTGRHVAQMKEDIHVYVYDLIDAVCSRKDVSRHGWYLDCVPLCQSDLDQLVDGGASFKTGDFVQYAYSTANELAMLTDDRSEDVSRVHLKDAGVVVAESREYHCGISGRFDRQFFQNFVPCGSYYTAAGSSLKTCYCFSKVMEENTKDMQYGKTDLVSRFENAKRKEHSIHWTTLFVIAISSIVGMVATVYYARTNGFGNNAKDDVEVMISILAATSIFIAAYGHIVRPGVPPHLLVTARREIRTLEEALGLPKLGAEELRWLVGCVETSDLVDGSNTCLLSASGRGKFRLGSNVCVAQAIKAGVFVSRSHAFLVSEMGLDVVTVTDQGGGLLHITWEKVDGDLVGEWADGNWVIAGCGDVSGE